MSNLNFVDVQILRKTSSGIRECVDLLEPDHRFKTIMIEFTNVEKTVFTMSFKNAESLQIEYQNTDNGCFVNRKFLRELSHHEAFCQDMIVNLGRQKTIVEEFRVDFSAENLFVGLLRELDQEQQILPTACFESRIKSILYPDNKHFLAHKLNIAAPNEKYLCNVLECFEPKVLKVIEIRPSCNANSTIYYWMRKLFDTKQWIFAQTVVMKDFIIRCPYSSIDVAQYPPCKIIVPRDRIQIYHLQKAEFFWHTISNECVFRLKENLVNSKILIKYKIAFQNCTIDESIENLLGTPYRIENDALAEKRKNWYFRMEGRDELLHVLYFVSKYVIFSSADFSSVPDDAWLNIF